MIEHYFRAKVVCINRGYEVNLEWRHNSERWAFLSLPEKLGMHGCGELWQVEPQGGAISSRVTLVTVHARVRGHNFHQLFNFLIFLSLLT